MILQMMVHASFGDLFADLLYQQPIHNGGVGQIQAQNLQDRFPIHEVGSNLLGHGFLFQLRWLPSPPQLAICQTDYTDYNDDVPLVRNKLALESMSRNWSSIVLKRGYNAASIPELEFLLCYSMVFVCRCWGCAKHPRHYRQ